MGEGAVGKPLFRFVDSRYGRVAVPDDDDDLIGRFVAHYGEWAYLETEYLAQYLPRRARVLDIGAFVGTFSMGIALAADVAYCCMVEANEAVTPALRANATALLECPHDAIDALVVDPAAHPAGEGRAEAGNAGSASFASDAAGPKKVAIPSNTTTLDRLTAQVPPFDLVKLDVEGMELQLLASCPALLSDRRCMLWVECNEHPRSLALAELMLQTGRPLLYFAWPSHNPHNHRATTVPIFPFACEAGLLLGATPMRVPERLEAAGCTAHEIHTVEDLRTALWQTPRWAPDDWVDLPLPQLVSIASHLQAGQLPGTFLRPDASGAAGGVVDPGARRELQFAHFRNGRLRDALATASDLLSDTQSGLKRAIACIDAQREALERARVDAAEAARQTAACMQHIQSLHLAETQQMLQAERASASALAAIQCSLTWRIARRVSMAASRIPLLRRSIRFAARARRGIAEGRGA